MKLNSIKNVNDVSCLLKIAWKWEKNSGKKEIWFVSIFFFIQFIFLFGTEKEILFYICTDAGDDVKKTLKH